MNPDRHPMTLVFNKYLNKQQEETKLNKFCLKKTMLHLTHWHICKYFRVTFVWFYDSICVI